MESDQITFERAIGAERARLWMRVRQDIAALRQLIIQSQQRMDSAPPSCEIGTAAAPAEQDAPA